MSITQKYPTLLIVANDELGRARLAADLRARGMDVMGVPTVREALITLRTRSIDLGIFELRLPDGSGHEILKAAGEMQPDARCLILTRYGDIAHAVIAARKGAVAMLAKPATPDEIVEALAAPNKANAPMPDHAAIHPDHARLEHIAHVFRTDAGGNVSKAARLLNMHRRTLQRTLDKIRHSDDAA